MNTYQTRDSGGRYGHSAQTPPPPREYPPMEKRPAQAVTGPRLAVEEAHRGYRRAMLTVSVAAAVEFLDPVFEEDRLTLEFLNAIADGRTPPTDPDGWIRDMLADWHHTQSCETGGATTSVIIWREYIRAINGGLDDDDALDVAVALHPSPDAIYNTHVVGNYL